MKTVDNDRPGATTNLNEVSSPEISVVIPAKDEQANISQLVNEICHSLLPTCRFEVILVDDGSTDRTFDEFLTALSRNEAKGTAIRFEKSVGQSTAIYAGVQQACSKYIATIDGDGQNDPADIPKMYALLASIRTSDFCIAGYRKNRNDTPWRKFQSRLANWARNSLIKDGIPDTGCGLKLIPRDTFLRLPYFDHMHRFLPALIRRAGGEIQVVVVNHRFRLGGVSKYTAWNRVWAGLVDLLGVFWLNHRAQTPVVERVQTVQWVGYERVE